MKWHAPSCNNSFFQPFWWSLPSGSEHEPTTETPSPGSVHEHTCSSSPKHTKATWRYRRPSVAGICKKAAPQSQLCYSDEMKGYGTKDELTSVHCIFQDVYPLYASTTHTEKANDAIQSCQFILISWGSGHREVQSASHLFASASQPGPHLLPRQWTRPDREARQLSRKSWEQKPMGNPMDGDP